MIKESLEDTILIQNILENDKKSEKLLYDKYKKILTDYLNKKYPQNSECDDDVSEILIKVFLSLDRFDSSKSKFKTWVFNIAKNFMIDKSRCSFKITNNGNTNNIYLYNGNDTITLNSSEASFDTTVYNGIANDTTFTTSNDCDFMNFENSISVNYVSNQLDSCDFSFLNMHYGYGYSYSEIGAEFNVSSNTVSNRVSYIKDKLKKNNINETIY